jgi:hypothetical protein
LRVSSLYSHSALSSRFRSRFFLHVIAAVLRVMSTNTDKLRQKKGQ